RVLKEVREDDCLGWAAQLAYYLLFAVFPFFLFLTALLGFLPIPNLLERIIAGLAMILPGEAVTLLQDNIRQLVTEQKGGLLSFGVLAALWSSSFAMVSITAAFYHASHVVVCLGARLAADHGPVALSAARCGAPGLWSPARARASCPRGPRYCL